MVVYQYTVEPDYPSEVVYISKTECYIEACKVAVSKGYSEEDFDEVIYIEAIGVK